MLTLRSHSFVLIIHLSASVNTQTHTGSRWGEIRAVNARAGRSSTWDSIRQGHERRQMGPDNSQSQVSPPTASNLSEADAERAQEQAHFDALLEAERRAAGRS